MKKKHFLILFALFCVVAILGGLFLRTALLYRATRLALIEEIDGAYTYNGKFLLSEDGATALFLSPVGPSVLQARPLETISFSVDDTALDFSYFSYDDLWFSPDPAYEGFWPVCGEGRFLYLAPNGEKYQVLPAEGRSYPLFSDSVDGVDPNGADVLAFSALGSYAVALRGTDLVIYHTEPDNRSLRVADVTVVSLGSLCKTVAFGAFVNDRQAYLYLDSGNGKNAMCAVDCKDGTVAPAPAVFAGETYGLIQSRFFALKETHNEKESLVLRHMLLGTTTKLSRPDHVDKAVLVAASPAGNYALITDATSGTNTLFLTGEKRAVALSDFMPDGATLIDADFLEEKVLFLQTRLADGTEKLSTFQICF